MTLAEQIGAVRRVLNRALGRHVAQKSNRPLLHLIALRAISRVEVRTQAELAERLLIDAAAVSRLVDRLEQEGLVTRHAGENRRCVRLEVTRAARREIEIIDLGLDWLDRQIKAQLNQQESRQAGLLLKKIQDGFATPRVCSSVVEPTAKTRRPRKSRVRTPRA
jgi:MarR family transcriptional regulator for hemolysin